MRYLSLLLLVLPACAQQGLEQPGEPSSLDANFFRCEVQPVLAASCAFMACHGNAERPLSIYAEQRFRLGITWDDYETPLTAEELAANFKTVQGFVAAAGSDIRLLSDKPLDTRAGGLFHRGKDLYGGDDVFLSRSDLGYQVLSNFGVGMAASDDCIVQEGLEQ